MEVELTFDAVNSCNFARKRQAAPESCSETQSKVNIDGYLQHVFWESFFCLIYFRFQRTLRIILKL